MKKKRQITYVLNRSTRVLSLATNNKISNQKDKPVEERERLIINATEVLNRWRETKTTQTSLEMVKEFHELFEHPVGKDFTHVEPLKIRQLRIKLLFEELEELAVAGDVRETFFNLCNDHMNENRQRGGDNGDCDHIDGDNVDKKEELDAITDLQYVLDGKKLTSGLHALTKEAFELIHENNMKKAHIDQEHAVATIKHINLDKGVWETVAKNGKVLLYNPDGKLTKPWDHDKVDLSKLLLKNF
jgi:predicted HAD superfamily Cof-like phosphohydrolase